MGGFAAKRGALVVIKFVFLTMLLGWWSGQDEGFLRGVAATSAGSLARGR